MNDQNYGSNQEVNDDIINDMESASFLSEFETCSYFKKPSSETTVSRNKKRKVDTNVYKVERVLNV